MRFSNRYELEAVGCVALLLLVILTLVCWSLYERGYLGIAAAAVFGVVIFAGVVYALRSRALRQNQAKHRRYQVAEREERLPREPERHPEYEEHPVRSVAQEETVEEHLPAETFEEHQETVVPAGRGANTRDVSEIGDEEFKRLLVSCLRDQGYFVETTLTSGGRGADLIIAAPEGRVSVLFKRQDAPVGSSAVQEAVGGRAFYGAYEAWLITDNTFAQVTRYDARRKGVRLVDGAELSQWLDRLAARSKDES